MSRGTTLNIGLIIKSSLRVQKHYFLPTSSHSLLQLREAGPTRYQANGLGGREEKRERGGARFQRKLPYSVLCKRTNNYMFKECQVVV